MFLKIKKVYRLTLYTLSLFLNFGLFGKIVELLPQSNRQWVLIFL